MALIPLSRLLDALTSLFPLLTHFLSSGGLKRPGPAQNRGHIPSFLTP